MDLRFFLFSSDELISYLQWTSLLPFFEVKLIKPGPAVAPISFSLFNYTYNYLYNNFVFNVAVLEEKTLQYYNFLKHLKFELW